MTDTTRALFDALVAADIRAYHARPAEIAERRAYRNGLVDAYVIVTGQDVDAVHEAVIDAAMGKLESYSDARA